MAQTPASTFLPLHHAALPIQMSNLPPPGSSPAKIDQKRFTQPWKFEGYQALSQWMASDDDFFVFRRFEGLNASTILWMQYRISELERRLEEIHESVAVSRDDEKLKNSSFKWDEQYMPERTKIMCELSCLLLQYNQFIDAFSKIRARPRAEERQIKNVVSWLKHGAISQGERSFVNKASDLIAINSRSRPPLGQWIEACQSLHLWKVFRAKSVTGLHVASEKTVYSSDSKFERFTTVCIIATGLIMLLAPMWWLEFVSDSVTRLKIITGFLCVFISIMTIATINRPFEVVAATAAYAAVLMVFMQISK